LPAGRFGRALELGCSIGVFTEQLAPRCGHLLALDFSAPAIALAERRVGGLENVELRRASFPDEAPAGRWDLIVCSEILYYLQPPELERAISWLRCQLSDGACAVAVSWRGEGRDEPFRGDEVHDRLARELAVWKTLDDRREGYRLDRFGGR
ncbi:MAG TPA: class I SAM-dependent methyltransferase, partial [Solirubrobacteraceae bacterium]|nr:class I SAM-dependent methyltransferase [Solirubrobacteraceae bacterium]